MRQSERAELFHQLHQGPKILVLPNAWDAASARLMQEQGAQAVATSSAAVAWAHGYADGDQLPVPRLVATLEAIARVISVPLTADIEGGYSEDPAAVGETVAAVIQAGAVGINLEDGTGAPDLLCAKIAAARTAGERAGVRLFINARTDLYLRGLAEGEAAFEETITRAGRYRAAGADGVFVPGPAEEGLIRRLAEAVEAPLNVMARGGAPDAARLQQVGVRRLSSATGLFRAAYAALSRANAAYLRDADPSALAEAGRGGPDFNAWFAKG